jgi:hypothetical protein
MNGMKAQDVLLLLLHFFFLCLFVCLLACLFARFNFGHVKHNDGVDCLSVARLNIMSPLIVNYYLCRNQYVDSIAHLCFVACCW